MKNTILKFLVIGLMTQSYVTSAFAQVVASPLDIPKLQKLVESGNLDLLLKKKRITQEQYENMYNEYSDLIESGGETAFVRPELTEREFDDYDQLDLANDNTVKDVAGATNVAELQKYSEKQVVGYGNWAFHFVYINNETGERKELAASNAHNALRPASTMKLFTTSLAFDLGTYTNADKVSYLLQHSKNGMADQALKSIVNSKDYAGYTIPHDAQHEYLNDPLLLNYRMNDNTEGKKQIIDLTILKGCSIMKDSYKGLEDSIKFHPVNGSGLQASEKDQEIHENKVTARLETSLLEKILANKDKYDTFKKYLPTPGGAGTLAARFKQGRKMAKIYAKTGTLGDTKALAGYAETDRGIIVFSIIGDRLKGVGVKEAMSNQIENVVFANIQYVKSQEAKMPKAAVKN